MSPNGENEDTVWRNPGMLSGWKGIAAYFGCNVRTARRYEQKRGLPVRRAPGKKGSTVFAHVSDLDAWLKLREKEQRPGLAVPTSGTARDPGDVTQNDSLPPAVTPVPAVSGDERAAKQVSLRPWQPWVFAASALLISSAVLFWMVEDHQTVSATTPARLNTSMARPHVPASGAEDLFLRGRYYWNLRTADGLAKAIDAYIQAIVRDPSYADAYAGLAETYDLLPQFGQADLGDSLTKAKLAADRALALNPNLASAHAAKAFAIFFWDWDIAGSDAEFRRALDLDPNSALAHQWYASTLQARDEGAECIRQIDEARRLNPTSAAIAADAAYFQADFGDFEAGVKALKDIEQTQPKLASPAQFLRELDFAVGDFPGYIESAQRFAAITHRPEDAALAEAVARGWAKGGRNGLLEERAKVLKLLFDRGEEQGYQLGETLVLLGDRESALQYFRAALNSHYLLLTTMEYCPWAKSLLSDPGYAELFAQVRARLHGSYQAHSQFGRVSIRLPLDSGVGASAKMENR